MTNPSITAICPTYGRFSRLKDAIACFILQDYPGEKHMHILNDAEIPLCLSIANSEEVELGNGKIVLRNAPEWFRKFGKKKQALVNGVTTDLIANWDDDDLMLPWRLSTLISVLKANPEFECIKPSWAWLARGVQNDLLVHRAVKKRFDGLMVFKRGTAVDYANATRQSAVPLLEDYNARGTIYHLHDESPVFMDIDYIFRKGDDIRHLSRSGYERWALRNFAQKSKDFGKGKVLLPNDGLETWALEQMRIQFLQIISGLKDVRYRVITDSWKSFFRRNKNKKIANKQIKKRWAAIKGESEELSAVCERLSATLKG